MKTPALTDAELEQALPTASYAHPQPGPVPGRMLIQWHITERCNLRCAHCYQDDQSPPDPSWDDLVSALQQFRSFIRHCRDLRGGRRIRAHITVTGGEPFVRSDFMDLLGLLSADKELLSFAVLTNGTMLDSSTVLSLSRLRPGFVQVSIDGSRETHDRIRGTGSYELSVHGLGLLVRAGIATHISFTAHRDNFRQFSHVAQLGRKLGVARVWADRMVPCGRGGSGPDKSLSPGETLEFIGLMQKEARRGWFRKSEVALHRSLQFTVSGNRPYRCSAGDTLVTVLPNGDVCPCRRMPLVVGNLFREHLTRIYSDSELFRKLRDRQRTSVGCEGCFYARTCGGGARCIASAVHGDPFAADPGCWLAKQPTPMDPRRSHDADTVVTC